MASRPALRPLRPASRPEACLEACLEASEAYLKASAACIGGLPHTGTVSLFLQFALLRGLPASSWSLFFVAIYIASSHACVCLPVCLHVCVSASLFVPLSVSLCLYVCLLSVSIMPASLISLRTSCGLKFCLPTDTLSAHPWDSNNSIICPHPT